MSEFSDAEQLRAEIEETRADLADTVNALSAKLDVKARAKAKVDDVRATVTETVSQAKHSAPPPVQQSLDRAGAALVPAAAKAKPYQHQILAAVGLAAVIAILARRRAGRAGNRDRLRLEEPPR